MKRLAVLLVLVAAAGCSSSSTDKGDPSHSRDECTALVGQPVKAGTTCGEYSASGSSGCYPHGKLDGSFYWINYDNGNRYLYGRPGSTWRSGPASMDTGEMAKVVGC